MISQIFTLLLTISQGLGPVNHSMVMPLPQSVIVNQFLAPLTPYGQGHRGIDLSAELNQTVFSPVQGKISFSGQVGFRIVVAIQTETLKVTLEPVCASIPPGTFVALGQQVGNVCQPSPDYQWHCRQTCIHFGLKTELGYLSPLALIGGIPPSRLKP